MSEYEQPQPVDEASHSEAEAPAVREPLPPEPTFAPQPSREAEPTTSSSLIYYFDEEMPSDHPVIGRLNPGPNDLTGYHPAAIAAAEAMAGEGTLRKG